MNREEIEEDEINLQELFLTFKNNIGTIFFITFLTVVVVFIYLYFAKPIYSSSVTIALDNQEQKKMNVLPGEFFLNAEEGKLELAKVTLKSRKFINTIIDRVDVDRELFIKSNFRKQEVENFSDIKIDIIYKNSDLYGNFFEILPLNENAFLLTVDSDKVKIQPNT
jgi:uncharacterized protein involved in exopolysaccharide biosynthesis